MCKQAILQQIIQTVREMPDSHAAEVSDFAEFLQRRNPGHVPASDNSFEHFFGILKDSPLFRGRDPVEIQREMRDEWR